MGQGFEPPSGGDTALFLLNAADAPVLEGPNVARVTDVVPEELFAIFNEAGFREHVVPTMLGVAQVSATVLVMPVNGAIVTEADPLCPAVIVSEAGVGVIEKSGRITFTNPLMAETLA